jgi:UDP-N-acetylmuramyl pentapeptide phosphotransferase/UDP-N-acetylglucosamine-1-phosphate transferase
MTGISPAQQAAANGCRINHPTKEISMKLAGIILIVLGVIALVYQGFTYTQTKQDAKIGPINIQHDETHTVPIPPIIGGVCIVAGIASLALGARKGGI